MSEKHAIKVVDSAYWFLRRLSSTQASWWGLMALGHPRARHLLTGAGSTPRIQHGGPSVSIIQWFRELNRGWPTATRPSVRNWTSNRIIIGDLASISIVVESICGWVTKDRSGAEGPPFSLRAPVKFVIALGLFPYYWICRANCLLFHGISPSHETIPPSPLPPSPPQMFPFQFDPGPILSLEN